MNDLRDAIYNAIEYGEWIHDEYGDQKFAVSTQNILELVAEYNIHFVEPDEKQLSL